MTSQKIIFYMFSMFQIFSSRIFSVPLELILLDGWISAHKIWLFQSLTQWHQELRTFFSILFHTLVVSIRLSRRGVGFRGSMGPKKSSESVPQSESFATRNYNHLEKNHIFGGNIITFRVES